MKNIIGHKTVPIITSLHKQQFKQNKLINGKQGFIAAKFQSSTRPDLQ